MEIKEAIYGSIVAGAVGDALGAVTENLNYWDIEERFGRVEGFIEAPGVAAGSITDDTTLKHVMCAAIIRKGGRITPDDLAKIWIEELNLDRVSNTDKISCMKLRAGVNPWEAGTGNIVTCCPSMSITPIGIINAGNPDQAYQDGYNIASMSGDGYNVEAAAVFSAGVAAAFLPGAGWETVIETMTKYSRYTMLKAVDLTMNLACKEPDIKQFRRKYYETLAEWWSRPTLQWNRNHYPNGTGLESIPVAMALTYLCKGDIKKSILEAVNFGRDTDTIANFIGGMLGPVCGINGLDPAWVKKVDECSGFLFQEYPLEGVQDYTSLAAALAECLHQEAARTEARRTLLQKILA